MKQFLQATLALLLGTLGATSAQAGEWELARIQVNSDTRNQDVALRQGYDQNGTYPLTEVHSNRYLTKWNGDTKSQVYIVNGQLGQYNSSGAQLEWNNGAPQFKGQGYRGGQVASSKCSIAVTPVFRWNGNDEPPKEMFYTETAIVSGVESYRQWDGNAIYNYTTAQPFTGKFFTYKNVDHPFQGQGNSPVHTVSTAPGGLSATHTFSVGVGNSIVNRIPVGPPVMGVYEVAGPTREFKGQIDLNASYVQEPAYDRHGSAILNFSYSAAPCRFALNVSANAFESYSNHPRLPHLGAYAAPSGLGVQKSEAAITAYLSGSAGYATSISPSLMQILGTPTYQWSSSSPVFHSQQRANGKDPAQWDPNAVIPPEELVGTSTPTKQFDHDLGKIGDGPVTTQTRVKVTGSNASSSKLTARATIDWYRQPETRFRSETYVLVHDYEAGKTTSYSSISALLQGSDEEAQINEYIAEIEGAYTETIKTGADLVGTALEVQMAIGSWYVPDITDGTITVVGGVAKRVFKVARGSTKFAALVLKLGSKLEGKSNRILSAMGNKLNHSNFVVEVRQRLIAETRVGHLPKDGMRSPEGHGEVIEDVQVCRMGSGSCFVAGTLVSTEMGLRAIETINKGDLVWSKSESSGQVELKPVTQTFQRHSATLVLTFANGENIETTKEHPFYVEGRGFVPAGELGLGTSIVTRAGPSVNLVSAQVRDEITPVFNFEVEDFHTYFVGADEAWVHNSYGIDEEELLALADHAFRDHTSHFESIGIFTKEELAQRIKDIIGSPISTRYSLPRGRSAWILPGKNEDFVIIHTPDSSGQSGTMYKVSDGKSWIGRQGGEEAL